MTPTQISILREGLESLRRASGRLTLGEGIGLARLEGLLLQAERDLHDEQPPTVRSGSAST